MAEPAVGREDGRGTGRVFVEARWPVALVVGGYLALSVAIRLWVPDWTSLGPEWAVPVVEALLLAVLLAADPGSLERRARWLRPVGLVLTFTMLALTITATVDLIANLIAGGELTSSATVLIASGTLIWFANVLVFSLLYWQLDSGGPLARYHGEREHPDLLFPQQASPEFAPAGWRPRFPDYLVLGTMTNTALSTTDVIPLSTWVKLTMTAQSLISLAVVGLVISRAVNIFN